MKRRTCGWCHKTQTTAEDGLCASCRRVWTRPNLYEAAAEIPPEQVEEIRELRRMGLAYGNVAKAMRDKHGPGPTGWGWHWAVLVIATG